MPLDNLLGVAEDDPRLVLVEGGDRDAPVQPLEGVCDEMMYGFGTASEALGGLLRPVQEVLLIASPPMRIDCIRSVYEPPLFTMWCRADEAPARIHKDEVSPEICERHANVGERRRRSHSHK